MFWVLVLYRALAQHLWKHAFERDFISETAVGRYCLKSAAAADDLETPDRLLCNPFQAVCLAATGVNGSLDPGDDLFLATVGTG